LAQDCEQDDASFEDGFCYGFVFDVFDSIEGVACAPNGVSGKQFVSIVRKYFKEYPEALHYTLTV